MYGIVLDPNHPNFEERTGRLIRVKWANQTYAESTVEHSERENRDKHR